MDRDMDAIRKIMLAVKASDGFVTMVEGIPDNTFKFNAMLLIEANLLFGDVKLSSRTSTPVPAKVIVFRPTWKGYEFIHVAINENLWNRAKKFIIQHTGSLAFDILFEYLKEEATSMLRGNNIH